MPGVHVARHATLVPKAELVSATIQPQLMVELPVLVQIQTHKAATVKHVPHRVNQNHFITAVLV